MIRTLEIQFPVDFEERYNEYKAKILGATRPTLPNLATDFSSTRKAQTEALKRALAKGEEREEIKKEIVEELGTLKTSQKGKNTDIVKVKTKVGLLKLNKNTGAINFANYNGNGQLNPQSREFKILLKLMTNKDYQATYKDLFGEEPSKTGKRTIGFEIRNLKKSLGILPAKKAKNKDCIKNIKGYGYRLII